MLRLSGKWVVEGEEYRSGWLVYKVGGRVLGELLTGPNRRRDISRFSTHCANSLAGSRTRTLLTRGVKGLSSLRSGLCTRSHCTILIVFRTVSTTKGSKAVGRIVSNVGPRNYRMCSFGRPSTRRLSRSCL